MDLPVFDKREATFQGNVAYNLHSCTNITCLRMFTDLSEINRGEGCVQILNLRLEMR